MQGDLVSHNFLHLKYPPFPAEREPLHNLRVLPIWLVCESPLSYNTSWAIKYRLYFSFRMAM